jgi:hypothetical protein
MSRNRKLVKAIRKIYHNLYSFYTTLRKKLFWLLRTFLVTKNRQKYKNANAGFVLPTVAMVSLVVVLLTVAILFRSFERSKNASNVRVNETTLNAAAPAVERARAKISRLFQDPRLPRSTPSNSSLTQVIENNINEFTFGDETSLKLKITDKLKTELKIAATLNDEEKEASTAWKYPVDTDNNGRFDSYTLYGLYYKTPSTTIDNKVRSRNPLEARAQPMDEGVNGSFCNSETATSANLIDGQGWFKVGGKLKRSLFVYTTTVPITSETLAGIPNAKKDKYETYKGNKGFVALEYQQDRERIPLNNNAVLYEDDLEIAPGAGLNINGRIFTNGNLLTRQDAVRYYLVSSEKSCYFAEENSKIIVAGNLINSKVSEDSTSGSPRVDLFNKPYDKNKHSSNINDTNKTVPATTYGNLAAYNDEAYARRIDRLVTNTIALYPNQNQLPTEVQQEIERDRAADKALTYEKARDEQLRIYFRRRTRRVPYLEVPFEKTTTDSLITNSKDYTTNSPLLGSGDTLRPINEWVFPFDPGNPTNATNYAKIAINENGSDKIRLEATDPEVQIESGKEERIGDRILVGNNLPQYWFDSAKNKFIKESEEGQDITGRKWDGSSKTRKRFSQAYQLDNLGITERDDFWEKSAAEKPKGILDIVGGTRIITGGGIYLPSTITSANAATTLPSIVTPTSPISVWSDSMPMAIDVNTNVPPQGLPTASTPYLRMRASVVYHYQKDTYDPEKPTDYQAPIACVSSYYDPTNVTTAKNRVGLPDIRLRDTSTGRVLTGLNNVATTDTGGLSNNGVVYPATSLSTSGYEPALKYQAQLKHPSGRPVNEQLQKAMQKVTAGGNLTLAEQSAIDSAVCALKIFDGTIGTPSDAVIPHGAIKETSFLDARQIKAIDKLPAASSRTYDLDVEFRQPLEIRTTVLDLDLLRRKSITGTINNGSDFLIPNTGIIYATREDALADASDSSKDVSATDFRLDPTRRPNGIMLINGSDLSRNSTYKPEEKGLILTSNLPVYIQGQKTATANEGYFNRHTEEEFTDIKLKTSTDWKDTFYERKDLNPNFACRKDQFSACSGGETWRPVSVIADSITVLSHNFRLGFRQDGDYDLRDNYGNYPVGYNVDGVTGINSATLVTLNEAALKMDLDGDGNMTSTNVSTWDETKIKTDIDGDGKIDKTSIPINESNITATVVARLNGFWDNNFVTSRNFLDSDYSTDTRSGAAVDSSYFNNFVTPIQRRVNYSEYVMEICRKATVTACTPEDWVVGYDYNSNGDLSDDEVTLDVDLDGDGVKKSTVLEKDVKASQLIAQSDANESNAYSANIIQPPSPAPPNTRTTRFGAGTTAQTAMLDNDRQYPRRVAFLRDASNNLRLSGSPSQPIPIGISNTTLSVVKYYPFSTQIINSKTYSAYSSTNRPRTLANTLWFKGTSSGSTVGSENYDPQFPLWVDNSGSLTGTRPTEQPLLVPVVQLQLPFTTSGGTTITDGASNNKANEKGFWMQLAGQTETNLIFAQGNTPGRPLETNGGLENFVRYLENWRNIKHIAAGAFIQFKRSSFATAPWQTFTGAITSNNIGYGGKTTMFGQPQGYLMTVTNASGFHLGRSPFYAAPQRFWGYDVALLTQLPDLFSQRFTTPSAAEPNEFFREVGRDDAWVKTLLCAAEDNSKTGAGYDNASNVASGFKYAVSKDQRPNACQ